MTETKLKPCPFCGGEAVMIGEDDGMYQVICPECNGTIDDFYNEKEVAAEKWNTRQIEEDLDKKNGYLIGTCHDLHDIVEEFRAECGQKDLEIKHLREALESIKEMSSYMSAGEITIYDLLDIHNICCDALKGEEE